MKIALINGASCSVVQFRQELIRYLKRAGHDVVVLACDDIFQEEIKGYGVTFYCTGGDNRDTGITSNLKYIKIVKNIIKKEKPDKVLTFQAKANTFGVIATKQAKVIDYSCFIEGLGNVFNNGGLKSKLLKRVMVVLYKYSFRKAKTVFLLNREDRDYVLSINIIKSRQVCLIDGIGVDINAFAPQTADRQDGKTRFVMIARMFAEKGVAEYCKAAEKTLAEGNVNAEFLYYGDSGNADDIVLDYANKGIIKYGGFVRDMNKVYAENDVVVLPSYHEGCPRSLMEACACGKAIIASDIKGCNLCVKDGYNGILVPKKDVDSLTKAMLTLINSPEKVKTMGANSRERATQIFDSDIINKKILTRIGL